MNTFSDTITFCWPSLPQQTVLPADSSEKTALSSLFLPQSGPLSISEGGISRQQHLQQPDSSPSRQIQTYSSPSFSPSSSPPLLFTPANDPSSQLPQTLSLSSSSSSSDSSTSPRVGQPTDDVLKSYTDAVASSRKDNSAKSPLSRDSIKSRLRSKHLKRTPSIQFIAQEDNYDDDNAELQQQQQSSDPRLDLIVSMLMKGLKESNEPAAYTENLEKSVNHRQLPPVPKSSARAPKAYFDYSTADSVSEPAPLSQLYIDVSVPVCEWVPISPNEMCLCVVRVGVLKQ